MRRMSLVLVAVFVLGLATVGSAQEPMPTSTGDIMVLLGFGDQGSALGKGMSSFFDTRFEFNYAAETSPFGPFRAIGGGDTKLEPQPGGLFGIGFHNIRALTLSTAAGPVEVVDPTPTDPLIQLFGTAPLNSLGQPQVGGSLFDLVAPTRLELVFPTGVILPIVLTQHTVQGAEPSILLLLGAGLAGVSAAAWRRRRS